MGFIWCDDVGWQEGFNIKDGVLLRYLGDEHTVNIPDTVHTIGEKAFVHRCVDNVILPPTVIEIGKDAFSECRYLQNINITPNVKKIGIQAFWETPWIKKQREKNPMVIINNMLVDASTCKGDVVIPEGVTEIIGEAFYKAMEVETVVIPEGVEKIGACAFFKAYKLKSVKIPKSVIEIGASAFSECYALKHIKLPPNITVINDGTFCDSKLTKIKIPTGVTKIDMWAFSQCPNLKEIELPPTLECVDELAFDFESLKTIKVPKINTYIKWLLDCDEVYVKMYYENSKLVADVRIVSYFNEQDKFQNYPKYVVDTVMQIMDKTNTDIFKINGSEGDETMLKFFLG